MSSPWIGLTKDPLIFLLQLYSACSGTMGDLICCIFLMRWDPDYMSLGHTSLACKGNSLYIQFLTLCCPPEDTHLLADVSKRPSRRSVYFSIFMNVSSMLCSVLWLNAHFGGGGEGTEVCVHVYTPHAASAEYKTFLPDVSHHHSSIKKYFHASLENNWLF